MNRRFLRLFAAISCLALAPAGVAQDEGNGAPPSKRPVALPGFVYVPAGSVTPGCTWKDYNARANNRDLKAWLIYDVWGKGTVELDGFHFGKFEVTNAQWKHYLDKNFRVEHVTDGTETLVALAKKYVKFRGEGIESEWPAIYAYNWREIVAGMQGEGLWKPEWTVEDPPFSPGNDISKMTLPKGIKLALYKHRTPRHWYGWCKMAKLSVGQEYCDIRKEAADAFKVPAEEEPFKSKDLKLRANDFAIYPIRNISPNEAFAFAEWAGCSLPTEYQYERAGRGDRPNTEQHTFPGPWDHNKQRRLFAWADNKACAKGPLPVDDESVAKSDSSFGARHMIGNVWELTRTFYDLHPGVTPTPPTPDPDITNYTLIAKGGSYGDRWQLMQISARTGIIGNAWLDLKDNNKTDSLGIRLVKHSQPGYDCGLHTVLNLVYDRGAAMWEKYFPHSFAMPRVAGIEQHHLAAAPSPYIHVKDKARALVFVPLWMTTLNQSSRRQVDSKFKTGKADGQRRDAKVLGVLRTDVALVGGVRLTQQEAGALQKKRDEYARIMKEYNKLPPKKKKALQGQLPPKPPEEDVFEKATKKNKAGIGVWREKIVPPGEYFVVYWYGFLGFANKAGVVRAIFFIDDPRKMVVRDRQPAGPARIAINVAEHRLDLSFSVEEHLSDVKRRQKAPGEANSELWALAAAHKNGWPRRRTEKNTWRFKVSLPLDREALQANPWIKPK